MIASLGDSSEKRRRRSVGSDSEKGTLAFELSFSSREIFHCQAKNAHGSALSRRENKLTRSLRILLRGRNHFKRWKPVNIATEPPRVATPEPPPQVMRYASLP